MSLRRARCLPLLSIALTLGCGDSEEEPSNSIAETLERLGVEVEARPRIDASGNDLPPDYAPLGARRTLNQVSEIVMFGVQLDDGEPSAGRLTALDLVPDGARGVDWTELNDPEDPPSLAAEPELRSAASGDFDGDGLDEVGVMTQAGPGEPIEIFTMEDADAGYAFSEPVVVVTAFDASSIELEAGDFDGDGADELIAALTRRDEGNNEVSGRLVLIDNDGNGWRLGGVEVEIPSMGATGMLLALSAGYADADPRQELAVAVNRTIDGNRRADLLLLDDGPSGLAELFSGRADFSTPDGAESAEVADVDLSDVDADGLDELLVGGIDEVGTQGSLLSSYLVGVWDDAVSGVQPLAAEKVSARTGRLNPSASGATQRLLWAHVNGVDVDADGADEIMVNQLVFRSLAEAPAEILPFLHDHDQDDGTEAVQMGIDEEEFFGYRGASDWEYSHRSSSVAIGDVDHDGREDVVHWSQRDRQQAPRQGLFAYGLGEIDGWREIAGLQTRFSNYQDPLDAKVLLPDLRLGNDTFTLSYSEASHRLVYTEPVIIAALAAAPCSADLGQDVEGSCRTAYGRALSSTAEVEAGISITAGVTAGFSASTPVVPSAGSVEVTRTVQATARASAALAYTVTKQVLRETGGVEDAVIFTSIPLDIYSYEVLSHPDPSLIGTVVEVRMPREPITAMVSRAFFNDNVVPGSTVIDDAIFSHSAGEPSSYRSRADKDALLRRYNGLSAGPFDVGQGGGQTIVTIDELTETTLGVSYEVSVSNEVKVTGGGAVAGFTVGASVDSALRVTRGMQTIYQGSVANLDSASFRSGAYAFGLFTYLVDDGPGQRGFEVVDYWVE